MPEVGPHVLSSSWPRPNQLYMTCALTSFSDFMNRDKEMLFCPVIVVRHYLSRTEQYLLTCSNFFISVGRKKWCMTKNSFWSWSIISETHRTASNPVCAAVKARSHGVRSIGTILLFKKNLAFQQVMRAGMWMSQTTLTSFYLREVTHKSMDTLSIGPVMAAQRVE